MKKRNATQTKELIIKTAKEEFAKHGFDGLRVDELALCAGINKATIYYHFKDKSFLFEKIIFELAQLVLEQIDLKLEGKSEPKEKFEAFLDAIIYVVIKEREVAQILMQEISFGGKNLNDNIKNQFFKVIGILVGIIKEGIEKKEFKDVDPFLIHSTILGSLNYYFGMKKIIENKENSDIESLFKKNSEKELKQMILNYILI